MVHVDGRICLRSATPMCMGRHESLEAGGVLVEVKWKWNQDEVGAPEGKKVSASLLRKAKRFLIL